MRAGRIAAGAWLAIALAALPALAQQQRVESLGVAPIERGDPSPRDSALRAAVRAAVAKAAASMLPAGYAAPTPPVDDEAAQRDPNGWLAERLGEDPFAYVTRFRILEDRGRRPAMFSADRDVEYEYVVMAEVHLDLDAIRARMEKIGLAEHSGRGPARQVQIVVEGLTGYPPLERVRETLARDRGVRSVVPTEFSRGRAVLAVDSDRGADALVADLTRRAPEGLSVVPVDGGPDRATIRVEWRPPATAPADDARVGAGAD
jgi:hypothetical protein